jgi:drug/metabolite transporter (DMT)-like permease
MNKRARLEMRDLAPIAFLGVAQFGILIVLLNVGLKFVPSARAALIFATFPILTMILGAALGRERLTLEKAGGVLLTVAGVAFVLWERTSQGPNSSHAWIGELSIFAAAVCGAICSVLYAPYVRKYPTPQVSALAMFAAVVFLGLLAATEGFFSSPLRLAANGWLAVLFIGISSGVGYSLWLWAFRHSTPTRVTVFLALSPITAAIVGTLFLAEPFTVRLAIGLVCVVCGLVLTNLEGFNRADRSAITVAGQEARHRSRTVP